MRVLVVGANGGLGRHVVRQALERGHEVTALVRRPDALPAEPGLRVLEGAVGDDLAAVTEAVRGQDAVVCALGNPLWLAGRRGPAVMARAAANLVTALHTQGVRRVVMPLAWGSGRSRSRASLPVRLLTRLLIRRDYQDFDTAEHILTGSGLDATVVYFGALEDRPAGGTWRADTAIRTPGPLVVSRADLAQCLLDAAETTSGGTSHLTVSGARKADRT